MLTLPEVLAQVEAVAAAATDAMMALRRLQVAIANLPDTSRGLDVGSNQPDQASAPSDPPARLVPRGRPVTTDWAKREADVEKILRTGGAPLRAETIIDRCEGRLSRAQVQRTLSRLLRQRRVVRTGSTTQARWALPIAVTARRAATSSARSPETAPELVSVWDGQKERSGDAPTLSSFGRTS